MLLAIAFQSQSPRTGKRKYFLFRKVGESLFFLLRGPERWLRAQDTAVLCPQGHCGARPCPGFLGFAFHLPWWRRQGPSGPQSTRWALNKKIPERQPRVAFLPSLEPRGLSPRDHTVRSSQSNHLEEMLFWPEKPGKTSKTRGALGDSDGEDRGREGSAELAPGGMSRLLLAGAAPH